MIISYTLAPPSLTITKSHKGKFFEGKKGTFTIGVRNNGPGPTDGTAVTVTDTLPAVLQAVSIEGTGWTCSLVTLTCTRSDVLAAESSYPPITLTVKADYKNDPGAKSAAGAEGGNDTVQVINTATVTGGGDNTIHTAADLTTIKCHKHHNPGKPEHR
ncbi:hypothetical protein ACFV5G_13325 [Streptomyces sp. NPDC059766]|uniref:hypothetical protein n=1 Tax=Streptomyces sp. NPDC059766 TaxID=3346940 RepID=UPI00364A5877